MITLMAESAISKRRRRLVDTLKNNQWKYQYSVFPILQGQSRDEDLEIASYALLKHDDKFRRKLGEQFPDTAILFEFRRLHLQKKFVVDYRKNFTQVYITFHSSGKLDEGKLKDLIGLIYPDVGNLKSRPVTHMDIEGVVEAIKSQRLHTLIKRKDGRRVNRFSIINENQLIVCK